MVQQSTMTRKFVSRLTLTALIGALIVGCFPVPVPWGGDDDDDDDHPHHHDLHEQSQSRGVTMYAHAAAPTRPFLQSDLGAD